MPDASAPIRVLAVDDHVDNRKLVVWILELEGYEVLEAGTGDEALAIAKQQLPDLVLLDLELPGIDGWEVARRLVADPRTARIPVVAITAHAQKTFVDRALEAGCVDVVTKPFMPEELPERLETALKGETD